MDSVTVLMNLPIHPYLETQLSARYNLLRLWQTPPDSRPALLRANPQIRAIVGNATAGADAATIDALPNLEIVASFSVGLDKVDLAKCRERGIRVTSTPDVLTDDVADLAIGLAISVMRRIGESDRYVREGKWLTQGNYKLTTKFSGKTVGISGLGRIGLAIAKRAEAFGCPLAITRDRRSLIQTTSTTQLLLIWQLIAMYWWFHVHSPRKPAISSTAMS